MNLSPAEIDAIAEAVVQKLAQRSLAKDSGALTVAMLAAADDPIAAIRARNRAIKARKRNPASDLM